MDTPQKKDNKVVLLVDGDNARPSVLSEIIDEVGKFGTITIRRIYGDWTQQNMSGWKKLLQKYAMQPIQQFRNTTGKNATDSALIIDAMDILHSRDVQVFCIVSSDSDFTRLATRIREDGLQVVGIGERKTPESFVKSCNRFIYTENLNETTVEDENTDALHRNADKAIAPDPRPLLIKAYQLYADEDEWIHLAQFGEYLRKIDPGFDQRTYGYRMLAQLIGAYPDLFEVQRDDKKKSNIFIRLKKAPEGLQTLATQKKKKYPTPNIQPELRGLLEKAYKRAKKDDGWVYITQFGIVLRKVDPDFNVRDYGFKKLSDLIKSLEDMFEIRYKDSRKTGDFHIRLISESNR